MSSNQPTAMCLEDGFALTAGRVLLSLPIKTGERFYGVWMQDGRFYYPMSHPDFGIVICVGGSYHFGPIIEE